MHKRALTEVSEIFGSILNSVPVGIVVANMDGHFLYFNNDAEKILGIGGQEMSPSDWTRVYGCYLPDMVTPCPTDQLPLACAIRGELVADQLIFIKNSNHPEGRWISVSGRPWLDEEGILQGGVIILCDVSERMNARRESQFKEQLLAALNQTADAVVITDEKGKIEYVNPAFESMTGYTLIEALGNTPRLLKSDIQDEEFYRNLWITITSGRSFQGTLANKKKNGQLFWTQQTITPMKDKKGNTTHFVSVWKDITDLLQHQERTIEMRLARDIQRQFFGTPPQIDKLDIGRSLYPAHETGGDYCDFFPMPDGRLGIVIGDVSGHGISAALILSGIRAYLRAFMSIHSDPGTIITLANRAMIPDLNNGRFATILLVSLDIKNNSLEYTNAGHPFGCILDTTGQFAHSLECTGPPLGTISGYEYPTSQITSLQDDQIMMLITDGIVEALSLEDLDLGMQRASQFVAQRADQKASDISKELCHEALYRARNQIYKDDISSIIIKLGRNS